MVFLTSERTSIVGRVLRAVSYTTYKIWYRVGIWSGFLRRLKLSGWWDRMRNARASAHVRKILVHLARSPPSTRRDGTMRSTGSRALLALLLGAAARGGAALSNADDAGVRARSLP